MHQSTIAVILNVSRLASKDSEYLHNFNIDIPKKENQIIANEFKLSGWVLSKKSPVESIEVLAVDKLLSKTKLQYPRQDVLNIYDGISISQENIGFSTSLDISQLSQCDKAEIFIKANFVDGNHEQLAKITVSFDNNIEHPGPDFIIIGAMKAATSAVYDYICRHPRVIRRYPKELHFFTLNFDKGLNWYLSQFDPIRKNDTGQQLLTGEASPSYLVDPNAASRIMSMFPKTKIILLLRNPTDRAISQYYHQVNRVENENRTIDEAFSARELETLEKKPISATHSYINNGLYSQYLKRWMEIVPQKRMLILNYHDLENNADSLIEKLFTFLGLEDHLITNVEKFYGNQYPDPPLLVKQRLDVFFKPYNDELEKLSGFSIENT